MLDQLKEARGYLAQGWCKDIARSKNQIASPCGDWVTPNPKAPKEQVFVDNAVSWSIMGALIRSCKRSNSAIPSSEILNALMTQIRLQMPDCQYISYWEDPSKEYEKEHGKRTQEQVLALFDNLIEEFNG